jgi:hypothetical protein
MKMGREKGGNGSFFEGKILELALSFAITPGSPTRGVETIHY